MEKPSLIVVDDDRDVAEYVAEVGESVGFEVQIAVGAKELQSIYAAKLPDGIIMDIVMPDMDGNELLQWLGKEKCTAPIILMSGYDGKYIEAAEYMGSASGCRIAGSLLKPVPLNDLKSLLRKILNQRN